MTSDRKAALFVMAFEACLSAWAFAAGLTGLGLLGAAVAFGLGLLAWRAK